ncbi:MAG: transcriptional repressor, partial [Hydrogenoanaerobacterium sp.]
MKYSRQRELVMNAVVNNPVHPTADYVYSHLREENPNISLGTVYRNLNLLA